MKNRLSLLACLTLLSWLQPAHAGLFDDDEARRRIEQTRQDVEMRLQKVEASNELVLSNQTRQIAQIEALRQDLARLTGQIEVLSNEADQTQKRQKDFYIDLDNRVRRLEAALSQLQQGGAVPTGQSAPAARADGVASNASSDPAQESRDYEAAINALRGGKQVDAAIGFKQFIKNYPKSGFLPGANFWLGASLVKAHDFEGARDAYTKVANTWPDDILAPDALLGLSSVQKELGDAKAERAALDKLIAKYPNSEAAKVAKQRLKKK